jgi:hypothetical protein
VRATPLKTPRTLTLGSRWQLYVPNRSQPCRSNGVYMELPCHMVMLLPSPTFDMLKTARQIIQIPHHSLPWSFRVLCKAPNSSSVRKNIQPTPLERHTVPRFRRTYSSPPWKNIQFFPTAKHAETMQSQPTTVTRVSPRKTWISARATTALSSY